MKLWGKTDQSNMHFFSVSFLYSSQKCPEIIKEHLIDVNGVRKIDMEL